MPWYIPALIFVARVTDVGLGTVRTIFVVRGLSKLAATIGFFEVIIWVLAVSGTLKYLSNPFALIAYGGGFAAGTMIGIWLERVLALGLQAVRVINTNPELSLADRLHEAGYPVTEVEGRGLKGRVEFCYIVVPRDQVKPLIDFVFSIEPKAFLSVEDVRETVGGVIRRSRSTAPMWMRIIKFK